MSYEAVRQIVEKRFFDTYSSTNAKAHGASAYVEGHDFVQPSKDCGEQSKSLNNGSWLVLSVVDGGSSIRAFNKGMRKTSGFVRFTLYVAEGTGTKKLRELADYVDSIVGFQGGVSGTTNAGNLYTQVGQLRKLTDNDLGYLKYALDFDYDYYE
tara:strand:- start:140 stop:601 length:462 start_codon:yes stop_codon:yes gene_type:complete